MRVLVSVAVWGRKYAATFCDYSLASQLAPGNLPRLAVGNEVGYHIITRRKDAKWLQQQPNVRELERHCHIIWEFIEDHGYDPLLIPAGLDYDKYPFLSQLQNIAIARSLDYDALILNYADFVWADGSVYHSIKLMQDGVDAVLSFGLPVDRNGGRKALDRYCSRRSGSDPLILPPRSAAAIAIDHLHREAKLRFWEGPDFTSMPTYLIWPVEPDGVLIRAYHQTVLVLRVKADDPMYRAGIQRGTLDGNFTAILADSGHTKHATNSDDVMVFSLYDAVADSRLKTGEKREDHLRRCLQTSVSAGQRRFAQAPFLVKRSFTDTAKWEQIAGTSWQTLAAFHESTPVDSKASGNVKVDDLPSDRWRALPRSGLGRALLKAAAALCRRIVVRLVLGRTGELIRRLLGRERARAWRTRLDRWIFRERSRN